MTYRLLPLFALLIVFSGCRERDQHASGQTEAVASEPAVVVEPTPTAPAWYENEIRAFEAADAINPPEPGQVLFIGSSSIRMWDTLERDMAPMPVLSRGFGGSKTDEVLAVFDRIVTPYQPAVIVYYCGDNDLGNDNTDSAAAANGFIAFDKRARALWPKIEVLYLPIKPSVARWNNWDAMRRANALVAQYCNATPGATYLPTVDATMIDGKPNPEILRADGLHLNEKGYAIWTEVTYQPILAAWRVTQH